MKDCTLYTLLYSRNKHKTVKQLFSNNKIFLKRALKEHTKKQTNRKEKKKKPNEMPL